MDSRIEELATIILERAKSSADLLAEGGHRDKDRYQTYRRLEWLSVDMLTAIHAYRVEHRDEYVDTANRRAHQAELSTHNQSTKAAQ